MVDWPIPPESRERRGLTVACRESSLELIELMGPVNEDGKTVNLYLP